MPRSVAGGAGLLTESEERVARLVQQGMRNREIAAALHYSPRSIEVYLSRIYAQAAGLVAAGAGPGARRDGRALRCCGSRTAGSVRAAVA